VQHRHSEAVSMRDKKEVASLTSAVLSPVCMPLEHTSHHQSCSSEQYEKEAYGCSNGGLNCALSCQPRGWIQTDIFPKWFDHFVHFIKLSCPSLADC